MKTVPMQFQYHSPLSVKECMGRICQAPCTFGKNIHNPEHYECSILSDTEMTVIFTGSQFGGTVRTEYLFTFMWNGSETVIIAKAQRELLFFLPFTSTVQLDIFFRQKVEGSRCNI